MFSIKGSFFGIVYCLKERWFRRIILRIFATFKTLCRMSTFFINQGLEITCTWLDHIKGNAKVVMLKLWQVWTFLILQIISIILITFLDNFLPLNQSSVHNLVFSITVIYLILGNFHSFSQQTRFLYTLLGELDRSAQAIGARTIWLERILHIDIISVLLLTLIFYFWSWRDLIGKSGLLPPHECFTFYRLKSIWLFPCHFFSFLSNKGRHVVLRWQEFNFYWRIKIDGRFELHVRGK